MFEVGRILHIKNKRRNCDCLIKVVPYKYDESIQISSACFFGDLISGCVGDFHLNLSLHAFMFDSVKDITNYYDKPLYKLLTGRQYAS